MNPTFLGHQNLIMLHVPSTSQLSEIMSHGCSEVFLSFIKQDLEILNARDHGGRTCLHVAIESADLDAVDILLHQGADKNLIDGSGLKPLEHVDLVLSRLESWKGGYSTQFDDIFKEICLLLQD
jgi:hypothetical protein